MITRLLRLVTSDHVDIVSKDEAENCAIVSLSDPPSLIKGVTLVHGNIKDLIFVKNRKGFDLSLYIIVIFYV